MARKKPAKKNYGLNDAMEAVARSLREFGYPDVTAAMCREIYDAWKANPKAKLPHGVVGMFAKSQFDDHANTLAKLK